jgi:putative transposase
MTDTNVFRLSQPGTFADPLTEVLREGAPALLAQAVEAEVSGIKPAQPTRRRGKR